MYLKDNTQNCFKLRDCYGYKKHSCIKAVSSYIILGSIYWLKTAMTIEHCIGWWITCCVGYH